MLPIFACIHPVKHMGLSLAVGLTDILDQNQDDWLLTSRESSAFTIQQSVQVATIKNAVEQRAKEQATY